MYIFLLCKFPSELDKIGNDPDISHNHIYLLKLHGNILKYYRLNLLKEIVNNFSHGLQSTLESPASFFNGLLV